MPKLNKFLQTTKILSMLDLRSTNLMDAGVILLCDGLLACKTLFHLNLAKNDITQSGIEKFAPILPQTSISELDMSLNPLGNGGVRILAENLWGTSTIRTMTSLETEYESMPTEVAEASVRRGKRCGIVKLNLSDTKIQEVGAFNLFTLLAEYFKL